MKYELRYASTGFFIEGANKSRYYIPYNQFTCIETSTCGSANYLVTIYLQGGKTIGLILDTESDARAFVDDIAEKGILYVKPEKRRD
jgi:hypothetical protein